MRYFLCAGEKSGDMHGANLLRELAKLDAKAEFFGVGGDDMKAQGQLQTFHYKKIAFMGFWEVFKNLFTISALLKKTKADIVKTSPDALVLIDFAGFNLKLAAFAKSRNIPVHYYISPKVWAWNQKRSMKIKKLVDKLYVVLPFEVDFFKKFDFHATYVGNPVLDAINAYDFKDDIDIPLNHQNQFSTNIVAVLPGSRFQEVTHMMHVLPDIIAAKPEWLFLVAKVDHLDQEIYAPLDHFENAISISNRTYELLKLSHAAIVTSGTATLETAILGIPQVVVYKTSSISYWIAKRLIRVPYISLVNLILDKAAVTELIQDDFNVKRTISEVEKILDTNHSARKQIFNDYTQMGHLLGKEKASQNTARLIYTSLLNHS